MTDDHNLTGAEDALGERLLSGAANEFESSLLRAALEEAPTEALSAKMLAPLGTGAVVTATVGGVGILKWALSGAAVLVVGGAYYLGDAPEHSATKHPATKHPATEHSTIEHPAIESPTKGTRVEEPASAPQETLQEPAPEPPSVRGALEREGFAESSPPARAPALPKKAASTLEEEMRLLDQARSALRARGNPAEALRLLAIYEEKFPAGALRQEATVLRVSALKESGAETRANELTSEFLKENPKSAHKKQLENSSSSAR